MGKIFLQALMVLSILFLFGCNSPEIKFSEIVVDDITQISSRNSGSGLLYSVTDIKSITHFINSMNSTTYSKVKPYEPIAGNSSLKLYNENNEIITTITSNGKGIYEIGDDFYKTNDDINDALSSFYNELYSDKNLVKE